jgi:hypothetical protein
VAQLGLRITLLLLGVLLAPGEAQAQAPPDRPSAPPLILADPAPVDKAAVTAPTESPTAPAQAPPEKSTPGRILPRLPHLVFRLSGGITLIRADTFCDLFVSTICPSAGDPVTVWPVVDAEFEVWWARSQYNTDKESLIVEHGISFGVNVTFGYYFLRLRRSGISPSVSGTLWEPHFDVLWGLPGELFWRVALGGGIYIASATNTAPAARASVSSAGATFRLGVGVTFLSREPVSLAIDFVGEGGWIGNVSEWNAQLLVGPEVHFD